MLLLLAGGLVAIGVSSAAQGAEPVADSIVKRSAADWYAMGGLAMHGLTLCSVFALALIVERLVALRGGATLPASLLERVESVIEGANPLELKDRLDPPRSALARVVVRILEPGASRESIEACGGAEVHRFQRNLPLLAAIGNLATMIGLFGTVMGMIEAFDMITVSGTGDARVVAGGIFRALVTTAAGLGVGITALGAHALLSRTADERSARLEESASALFDAVHPAPHVVSLESDEVPIS